MSKANNIARTLRTKPGEFENWGHGQNLRPREGPGLVEKDAYKRRKKPSKLILGRGGDGRRENGKEEKQEEEAQEDRRKKRTREEAEEAAAAGGVGGEGGEGNGE